MKRASKLHLRANFAPSKLPFTIRAVAQASAAMQVFSTTVTEAVLDSDRDTVQRALVVAGGDIGGGALGFAQRHPHKYG